MRYQEPEFLPWDGRRVPITFLGGYLGAGKTTLINEALLTSDRPIAVIVNDVGSLNIDAALIHKRYDDVIEVTGGCVCCSSLDGMGAAFDQLRARPFPPDHVLIELSGVAEPQRMLPWAQTAGFMLDGVVIVVAADQLIPGALPHSIEQHFASQIAAADLLVLTKTDLVDDSGRHAALRQLAALAPQAPVLERCRGQYSNALGTVLMLGGRRPGGLTATPAATLFDAHQIHTCKFPHGLSLAQLRLWLDSLAQQVDGLIVRAKGVVDTTDFGLVLVQVVGARCEVTSLPEPEAQDTTDLIVITVQHSH